MATLFISDLHLDPRRPAATRLFLDFLEHWRGRADALYILGDLFEAWIGDDAVDEDDAILGGMRAFAAATPLRIMHGNRDFLLGERFCALTSAELLPDPSLVDLYGVPTLLMHGDSLCTDDREYQQVRTMLRDPAWQKDLLAKPLAERQDVAARARQESSSRNAGLADYLMDVNARAVAETMQAHEVRRLIHGHTHRPAVHRFTLDDKPAERIVLGDWYDQGSVLEVGAEGFELKQLPLP